MLRPVQPRGQCPVCMREKALLSDGTVARPHKGTDGLPCRGYGQPGLPLPQVAVAWVPAFEVRKNPLTGKWRVYAMGKLDSMWLNFDAAWDRVYQMMAEAK